MEGQQVLTTILEAPQMVTAGPTVPASTQEKNTELVLLDIRQLLNFRTGWAAAKGTCVMQTPDRVGPGD